MLKVNGKGGIEAVIVADSKSSVDGQRITTFLLTYHRYIHGELMSHRAFSRNAMSSRAVPVKTMLELVKSNPATPTHWGKNQPGMQAKKEWNAKVDLDYDSYNDEYHQGSREQAWIEASKNAISAAASFSEAGYHKQIVNRLVEPFQMIRVLVTATSFDNFFNLRFHEDAQPEIFELSRCMLAAYKRSEPEVLQPGEWHTPFVKHNRMFGEKDGKLLYSVEDKEGFSEYLSVVAAIKVSCSCSAQTSYRKVDTSIEKALSIYEKLIGSDPAHSSAFEHCATPMPLPYNEHWHTDGSKGWINGITHVDTVGNFWSNNFKGWIQYRALIPNNVCVTFDYSREVDEDGLTITDTEEI